MKLHLCKPTLYDIPDMLALVSGYVESGIIINRDKDEIAATIRSYFLARQDDEKGMLVGMVALNIYSTELAEVRSMVVHPEYQAQGVGRRLLNVLHEEAYRLGLKQLLVLTYRKEFFEHNGFCEIDKHEIPNHKIWADCIKCKHFPTCNEIALIKSL